MYRTRFAAISFLTQTSNETEVIFRPCPFYLVIKQSPRSFEIPTVAKTNPVNVDVNEQSPSWRKIRYGRKAKFAPYVFDSQGISQPGCKTGVNLLTWVKKWWRHLHWIAVSLLNLFPFHIYAQINRWSYHFCHQFVYLGHRPLYLG